MIIQELTEDHLRSIEFREIERADLGDTISQESIDWFMTSDYKKAVMDGNEVVMVLGGIMEGKMCRTWLLASKLIYKNPIACFEVLMDLELEAIMKFAPDFLYTFNLPEFKDAIKFLKRVGYYEYGEDLDLVDNKKRIILVKKVFHGF